MMGVERFRRIFECTVMACATAGIAKGEVVRADATLVRADVRWENLAVRHVEAAGAENGDVDREAQAQRRHGRQTGKDQKVRTTDPDASMATDGRNRRLEPSYKQHGVGGDACGVGLEVEVTPGEIDAGQERLARLDAAAQTTGSAIRVATAAAG
jgi:hypothetical protein